MEIQLKKNIQQSMKRLDLYLIRQFLTILRYIHPGLYLHFPYRGPN